jgi:hypothetical protein
LHLYVDSTSGNLTEPSLIVRYESFADLYRCAVVSNIVAEIITLEALLDMPRLSHIDILIIDIEGAEYYALQGAESLLKNASIGCVAIECSARSSRDQPACTLSELMSAFSVHNYVLIGSTIDWVNTSPFYCNNNAYFFSAILLIS